MKTPPAIIHGPVRRHWWRPIQAARQDWYILRALTAYRFALIAILIALQSGWFAHAFFDHVTVWLYRDLCFAYLTGAILLLITTLAQRPRIPPQAYLHFVIDTTALTILVYACQGVDSGIGMLLITPIVACSFILPMRAALFIAALGTFAIFGEEALRQYQFLASASEATSSGILGLVLFVVALAGNGVARRARSSEAVAWHAQTELDNLLRLNQHIVETMQTGVLGIEADGRVRLSNLAARKLLNAGEVDTLSLSSVAPPLAAALRAWRSGNWHEEEVAGLLPRFTALESGPRDDARTLILLDDATRLRQQAQQLKLASLGQLTANIAHEIRNPLSALGHASQLLAENPQLSNEDRKLVAMIERQGGRINKIVADILSLSRSRTVHPQTLGLQDWLQRCAETYVEMYPEAGDHIHIRDSDTDIQMYFDPQHLQRILHNLWHNSFEHAGHEAVVYIQASRRNNGQPCITTCDNGPGIPAHALDHVFEPFFTTAHNGTGLGLYIARELCEYNQASLEYESIDHHAQFRIIGIGSQQHSTFS